MAKFKEKLIRLMYGRYGSDSLNTALIVLYLVFALLFSFSHWPLFSILMAATLVWAIFRMFSRNYAARRRENEAFGRLWRPLKCHFTLTRDRIRDFRTHVYHKCPHCKAMLRLPRKKGQHTVRCPRCHDSFAMKVYFGGK